MENILQRFSCYSVQPPCVNIAHWFLRKSGDSKISLSGFSKNKEITYLLKSGRTVINDIKHEIKKTEKVNRRSGKNGILKKINPNI